MTDSNFTLMPLAPLLPEITQRLLGPNGQPINPPVTKLTEQDRAQASMVAFDAYLLHAFRFARYNPDALIGSQGYEVLDKMLELASYEYPLRILKAATLYKPWKLLPAIQSAKQSQKKYGSSKPYDDAMAQYDFWNEALCDIRNPETDQLQDFRHVLWYMMDAAHVGFSVNEMIWRQGAEETRKELRGKWLLQQIVPRRPRQISFELDAETLAPRQLYSTTPLGGIQQRPIPLEKVLLMTYNPRHGLPYGWGLARVCYKHYWLIEQTIRSWAVAVKKSGTPFLEGTTNDPNGVARLASVFAQAGDSLGIVHTGQDKITLHALSGQNMVIPEAFVAWNEAKITQTILGQTLTTSAEAHGSFAQAHIHENTRNFFLSYPRHEVENTINTQLLRRGSRYNFGADQEWLHPRLFLGHWNEEERMSLALLFEKYRDMGYLRASDSDWVRDETGFPPDLSTVALEDLTMPELLPGRERVIEQFGEPSAPGAKPKPADSSNPSKRDPTVRRTNDTGSPAKKRG